METLAALSAVMKRASRLLLASVFALTMMVGDAARLAAAPAPVSTAAASVSATPAPKSAAPWLFLSDIHFDPNNHSRRPSRPGSDTNAVLLRSTIAEMVRVDPAAPVVVITGDFLAHETFDTRGADAVLTLLAKRFNTAFPNAQFVITLGNEDSGCGDYGLAAHAAFLSAVARAWAPLVNRHGAAPTFARTFSNDGFYTARLPIKGLRAVVIDDVVWAPRYRPGCEGPSAVDATLTDLKRTLGEHRRSWLLFHIPPGIDAYSTTHLVHHLVDVPFLDSAPRDALLGLIGDPRSRVALVLAAHTHKFSYRIVGTTPREAVPMLLIPSISPIFSNAPAFLTVDVGADGTIEQAVDHAFVHRRWETVGGTRTLGLRAVTGPELLALQTRLARSPQLRETFARLYNSGAKPEITEQNWRDYWCAATAFAGSAYRTCLGSRGGVSFLTRRGVSVVGSVAVGVLAVVLLAGLGISFRRSRQR